MLGRLGSVNREKRWIWKTISWEKIIWYKLTNRTKAGMTKKLMGCAALT